jgi:hypothetical protein
MELSTARFNFLVARGPATYFSEITLPGLFACSRYYGWSPTLFGMENWWEAPLKVGD